MRRGAFTLIEVLAVVTIVALATAALTIGLGAADANARLRALTADLIDLDARARLLARTDGTCELRFPRDEAEREVALVLVSHEDAFSTVVLPMSARAEARTLDGDPLEAVRFDRSGRTPDYSITVSMGDLTAAWTVAGLTGWIEREIPR